ncbi:MAG: hypothetical protein ACTSQI_18770, partial [Candidatus Helarchaeota archaeon]
NFILHCIEAIGIISLIFAIWEIRRGNNQQFREVLAKYLQFMRERLCERFGDYKSEDEMLYKNTLLMLDQCIFSILSQKNKIKKDELADELSRLSITLYFDDLDAVKEKMKWFKRELFR